MKSIIIPIIGFVLLIAMWVLTFEVIPMSAVPLYCALAINSGLLVWFLGKALEK